MSSRFYAGSHFVTAPCYLKFHLCFKMNFTMFFLKCTIPIHHTAINIFYSIYTITVVFFSALLPHSVQDIQTIPLLPDSL